MYREKESTWLLPAPPPPPPTHTHTHTHTLFSLLYGFPFPSLGSLWPRQKMLAFSCAATQPRQRALKLTNHPFDCASAMSAGRPILVHNTLTVVKAFRVRTYSDKLIMEYQVPTFAEGAPSRVVVMPCGDLVDHAARQDLYPPDKDELFQSLVHDQFAPCVGPSRNWSCIRRISYEEYVSPSPPHPQVHVLSTSTLLLPSPTRSFSSPIFTFFILLHLLLPSLSSLSSLQIPCDVQ
jgi:hypothetical protein